MPMATSYYTVQLQRRIDGGIYSSYVYLRIQTGHTWVVILQNPEDVAATALLVIAHFLEISAIKVGDIVIVTFLFFTTGVRLAIALVGFSNLLEVRQVVGAQLVNDDGQQFLQALGLRRSANNVCVCRNGCLYFGARKVNDLPILLEQINFFNSRDVIHPQLFQGAAQFLVVRSGGLVYCFLFSTHGALAARADVAELRLKTGPCRCDLVRHSLLRLRR